MLCLLHFVSRTFTVHVRHCSSPWSSLWSPFKKELAFELQWVQLADSLQLSCTGILLCGWAKAKATLLPAVPAKCWGWPDHSLLGVSSDSLCSQILLGLVMSLSALCPDLRIALPESCSPLLPFHSCQSCTLAKGLTPCYLSKPLPATT